eukprot:361313-Chlamydomonas_euryale.AAC.15
MPGMPGCASVKRQDTELVPVPYPPTRGVATQIDAYDDPRPVRASFQPRPNAFHGQMDAPRCSGAVTAVVAVAHEGTLTLL